MAVWEVAARQGTVSCASWCCPSLDSPKLTEYGQENPKHSLFATCRTLRPPSAQWSRTGSCSSGDDGDDANVDDDDCNTDVDGDTVITLMVGMVGW